MFRQLQDDSNTVGARRRSRSGSVVLEFLMALPILVMAMDLVVRMTFDAAFVNGMSVAAIEAAREGAQVFPRSLPFSDPNGEALTQPSDGDDVVDRIVQVVERRLRLLRLNVAAPDASSRRLSGPAVRLVVRRGAEVVQRGDDRVPLRMSPSSLPENEIEVVLAVRFGSQTFDGTERAAGGIGGGSWFAAEVLQASARAVRE